MKEHFIFNRIETEISDTWHGYISLSFDLPDHAKNSRPRVAAVAGHDDGGKRSSGIDADDEVLLSCHEILSEIALQAELCKGVPDVKDEVGLQHSTAGAA